MNSLYFEAKKTMLRPVVLGALLLLLLINGYACQDYIDHRRAEYTPEYLEAYSRVYDRVEGTITQENMRWIVAEKKRLNAIIRSQQFSTEPNQPGTYTGYVYSDNNLINALYDEAKYAYEYADFAKETAAKAQRNVRLYQKKNNPRLAEYYRRMGQSFAGRRITSFYRTDGWEAYFSYSFSHLATVLILLWGLTPLFSVEKETNTYPLLRVTPAGLRKIYMQKTALAFLFCGGVSLLFSVQDLILFGRAYGFRGWNNPLYAVPAFQNTGLSVSIGGYVVLNYAFKLLGLFAFVAAIVFVSAVTRSNLQALGASVGLLILSMIVCGCWPEGSFISLLNSIGFCTDYSMHIGVGVGIHLLLIGAFLLGIALIATPAQRNSRFRIRSRK